MAGVLREPGVSTTPLEPVDGLVLRTACLRVGLSLREALWPHVPRRPEWVCAADGLPWPCLLARAALLEAMDAAVLDRLMSGVLHEAACDIDDPRLLWQQFMAWTQPGQDAAALVGVV